MSRSTERALVLLVAVYCDAVAGDPPTAAHPVGWFGRAARLLERVAPSSARARRRYGITLAAALPLASVAAYGLLARATPRMRLPREVLALDLTFALHTLLARADEVRVALESGDLEEARLLLRTHLVSRDTAGLSAGEVAGATIESVAENLGDGVVAPWLAYAVAGVPGAIAYRAIDTLDAMWGYRTPPYVDLGYGAARLDDFASWLPSRVTAAAIGAAAAMAGADARAVFEVWWRDHARTESPNAGHPMAAMAGALGVTLSKRDAYAFGGAGREPTAADISEAVRIARVAALLVGSAIVLALLAHEER